MIIDEAQHLHPVLLEQLRLGSNLDGDGPPLLQLLVSRDNHAFQSNIAGIDLVTGTWAYGLATYGVGPRWYWQTE